jgi:hypothetical protein
MMTSGESAAAMDAQGELCTTNASLHQRVRRRPEIVKLLSRSTPQAGFRPAIESRGLTLDIL